MSQSIHGVFEPDGRGGGHIRRLDANYGPRANDVALSGQLCKSLRLRGGEALAGTIQAPAGNKRSRQPQLAQVELISDRSVEDYLETKPFEELTAIDPRRPIRFETPGGPPSMRIIDLMTPMGFGQRGLIVSPPRAGKTILLQQMAHGVATNHPDVHLIVLLVDERPEEVTDMRRSVKGEVVASSNDQDAPSHMRISRLIVDRARRLVEVGDDVVMLLDSLTRLGRAFNAGIRGGRRTMSGGLDIKALSEPKGIFGAARNVEGGGSLTIIATALIDTGSRMDEVIFNEFKGTGNMEIMLSREMANRRLWPAIDLNLSGTRKEELLLTPEALGVSHRIRRTLVSKGPERSMELLLEAMQRYSLNADFIKQHSDRMFR